MKRGLTIGITLLTMFCYCNILFAQEQQPLRIDAVLAQLSRQNPQMMVGYEGWFGLNDSLDRSIDWKALATNKDRFAAEIEKETDYKMVTKFGSLIILPKNVGENNPPLIESYVSTAAMTDKTFNEILSQVKGVSRKVKFLRPDFGPVGPSGKSVSVEGAEKIELGQLLAEMAHAAGAKRWLLIHIGAKDFGLVELLLSN